MSIAHRLEDWQERVGGAAVLLSLLIHAVLAILMFTDVLVSHGASEQRAEEPAAIDVSLVPEPKKQPPPPPPAPEPEPAPKPEPEKQQQPPPQPMPKPTPPPAAPPKAPPKPVLDEGKLAKESKAPKHNWLDDAQDETPPKESHSVSPFAKASEPLSWSKGAKRQDDDGPATQTERDYLLAQVLKTWKNKPNFTWAPDAVVHLRVQVMPDGYLASPFNAKERYSPELAIVDYESFGRGDPRKIMLESLYSVLRVSQPLTLSPELKAKAPFETVLDFRLVDIP